MLTRLTLTAAAALLCGCAVTPEIAAGMSDGDLCFAHYDQFSFTGRTEAAIKGEIARRGIDCSATGRAYRQRGIAQPEPPRPATCTSSVIGRQIYTNCY